MFSIEDVKLRGSFALEAFSILIGMITYYAALCSSCSPPQEDRSETQLQNSIHNSFYHTYQ
jgi:hypothetical protein